MVAERQHAIYVLVLSMILYSTSIYTHLNAKLMSGGCKTMQDGITSAQIASAVDVEDRACTEPRARH